MHNGNYLLVLHTHLPWVLHHGTWPFGVDWLSEAVAECYIPLLNVFNELVDDGIQPKVNIDISPILCEQLEHPDFKDIFVKYCDEKIKAAQRDEENFKSWCYDLHHIYLTQYWQQWYLKAKNDFIEKYDKSIVSALRKLQDNGSIEIMTCAATHGYLPLLGTENSINLQIQAAVENYKKHFGRNPRGIWLPECAYRPSYEWQSLIPVHPFHIKHLRPGIEQFLSRYGIEYFCIDENLTKRSTALGVFLDNSKEKFVPIDSPSYKTAPHRFEKSPMNLFNASSSNKTEYGTAIALTRHHDIAMQVWSGSIGYPAEPDYLDFHKKHMDSMLRYWRVTDAKADMMYKSLYHPDWTRHKIDLQANHFIHHLENTVNHYHNKTHKFASLCTPFDTELFGHWWFEGPEFIKAVLKGLHHSPYVKTATASEQIYKVKPEEVMLVPEGSWGENNNHDVWSGSDTTWTWESIYNNENKIRQILCDYPPNTLDELMTRILKQAMRELLLVESSDWQFLIYTKSAKHYAEQRFAFHHSDFNKICDLALEYKSSGFISEADHKYLEETEKRNSCFQELQLDWWHE